MDILTVKTANIKPNDQNPRYITEEKFESLKKSIKDFPEMLEKRPLIVDENMVVLGGNMRLKAIQDLKIKTVPVIVAEGWTEEQKNEFIIKDNVGFGSWDWDILANNWDSKLLNNWGLEVWNADDINLDEFFEQSDEQETENDQKIILEYSAEDYEKVIAKLESLEGSPEKIIWNLLGL